MGIAGAGNSEIFRHLIWTPLRNKWAGIMFCMRIIPLLTVFLYILLAKDAPSQPAPKPLTEYLKVFKQKDTWYFCLLYSVTFGGFVGLSSFFFSSIFFAGLIRFI